MDIYKYTISMIYMYITSPYNRRTSPYGTGRGALRPRPSSWKGDALCRTRSLAWCAAPRQAQQCSSVQPKPGSCWWSKLGMSSSCAKNAALDSAAYVFHFRPCWMRKKDGRIAEKGLIPPRILQQFLETRTAFSCHLVAEALSSTRGATLGATERSCSGSPAAPPGAAPAWTPRAPASTGSATRPARRASPRPGAGAPAPTASARGRRRRW